MPSLNEEYPDFNSAERSRERLQSHIKNKDYETCQPKERVLSTTAGAGQVGKAKQLRIKKAAAKRTEVASPVLNPTFCLSPIANSSSPSPVSLRISPQGTDDSFSGSYNVLSRRQGAQNSSKNASKQRLHKSSFAQLSRTSFNPSALGPKPPDGPSNSYQSRTNLMTFNQIGPANQAFHKTQKRIQSKREQKQQLAKKIAIKNQLLQKHNFHFILSDSQMLKESNLPFTQMQYMQIIESKRGSVGFLGGDQEKTQGAD